MGVERGVISSPTVQMKRRANNVKGDKAIRIIAVFIVKKSPFWSATGMFSMFNFLRRRGAYWQQRFTPYFEQFYLYNS